jgi:flagellar motor switch protein FliN/FliY
MGGGYGGMQGYGGPMGGGSPMGGGYGQQMGGYGGMNPPNVQPVQFASLQMQQAGQESGNIGLIMDVNMEMTVELGRTRKLIKEILGMGEGTIIELDKLAGEPVDILVNHKLIAKGEVVVIDENFGVRVTEIVSPMERMVDLG